ncbi:MAG: hypothetical protein ACK5RO_04305, partial [Pseudobdellovibrionaceae bacterium]
VLSHEESDLRSLVSKKTRAERVNQLYALYNQRFDAQGNFVENRQQTRSFIQAQDRLIAEFRLEGAIQSGMIVRNSFKEKVWVQVDFVIHEDGSLLGLIYERGEYNSELAKSILRIRSIEGIKQGETFVEILETAAVSVKAKDSFENRGGGLIDLHYVTNLKEKKYALLNVEARRIGPQQWIFVDPPMNTVLKQIDLEIWFGLFPPNGGVEKVKLGHREIVP